LRQLKLKRAFVPAATMVNCESADLAGTFRFIRRQMLWLWLSHSAAGRIVGDAFISAGMFWLPLVVTSLATVTGDTLSAGLALAAWTIYQAGLGTMINRISVIPQRVAQARGDSVRRFGPSPRMAILGIATQVIYQAAIVSMLCSRKIEWRGISYRFNHSGRFRLIEYRPYAAAENGLSRRMSL
jgi:uncharacterized membrane protein